MPHRKEDEALAGELARRMGGRIRRLRMQRGLTQAALSERLGMTSEAFGRIERGLSLPSFPTFVRVCDVLETTPDRLLVLPGRLGVAEAIDASAGPDGAHASPYPTDEMDAMVDRIRCLEPRARRALSEIVHLLWHGRGCEYPQQID